MRSVREPASRCSSSAPAKICVRRGGLRRRRGRLGWRHEGAEKENAALCGKNVHSPPSPNQTACRAGGRRRTGGVTAARRASPPPTPSSGARLGELDAVEVADGEGRRRRARRRVGGRRAGGCGRPDAAPPPRTRQGGGRGGRSGRRRPRRGHGAPGRSCHDGVCVPAALCAAAGAALPRRARTKGNLPGARRAALGARAGKGRGASSGNARPPATGARARARALACGGRRPRGLRFGPALSFTAPSPPRAAARTHTHTRVRV